MSCCGQKRTAISKPEPPIPWSTKRPAANSIAWFRYSGSSTLTVVGRVTQTAYRFSHQGAVLATDVRDTMSLTAISSLQRVSEPRNQPLG
jgi:hypothetical protein